MTSRDFCFWLQGFLEIRGNRDPIDADQVATIQQHLAMVFTHEIDPAMGDAAHQVKLDALHKKPGDGRPPIWRC